MGQPPKRRGSSGRKARREALRRAQRKQRVTVAAFIGGGVLLLVLVAVFAFSAGGGDTGNADPADFDLPTIDGEGRVRLADHRGQPVVVNFFASWCTACDAELPGFREVEQELDGQVTFIGVNAQETGDRMFMVDRHGIDDWILARDIGINGDDLHRRLGGRGMPITAFYDDAGQLIDFVGGAIPEPQLRERLRSLYEVDV